MASSPRVPVERHEIFSRVQTILRRLRLARNGEPLAEDVGLLGHGIGLDSVEILGIVAAVEEEFGLTIDDQSLKPEFFLTVGTLVAFIQERTT